MSRIGPQKIERKNELKQLNLDVFQAIYFDCFTFGFTFDLQPCQFLVPPAASKMRKLAKVCEMQRVMEPKNMALCVFQPLFAQGLT